MPKDVTDQTLTQQLSNQFTVVDLWAPWCGPCRMVGPILEQLEEELDFSLLKLNIDDNPATPTAFGVQSIPTLILYRDGKPVEKITGAYPKAQLKDHLAAWMAQ